MSTKNSDAQMTLQFWIPGARKKVGRLQRGGLIGEALLISYAGVRPILRPTSLTLQYLAPSSVACRTLGALYGCAVAASRGPHLPWALIPPRNRDSAATAYSYRDQEG